MQEKNLRNRLLVDSLGLIGVILIYFSFVTTQYILSFNDWTNIISLIVLAFTGGVLIGFISFKRDGIAIAGTVGLTFLVILVIYGIRGIGIYEITGNYGLSIVIRVSEGLIIFCLNVLGAFIGKIIVPKRLKSLKGETTKIEKEGKGKKESTFERLFCSVCGSEVPREKKVCTICGNREK